MTSYCADEKNKDERIDKFLAERLSEQSRSYIQKLIKDHQVLVNAQPVKANYRLSPGDCLTVTIPAPKPLLIQPENIPLAILYEDDDLIIVDKPKGMVVHPAPGHYSGTLVNALLYHCQDNLSGINGVLRPGIVHRIDKDTTGALVVCKNDFSHQSLARQLKEHTITRVYEAIVYGNIKTDEGTVDAPIGRDPADRKKMSLRAKYAKPAVTHYQVLERFGRFTYIRCRLETGRTHQIRVHLKSIGHPLLGDPVYGPRSAALPGLQGQTLHARILGITHPRTGEYIEVESPLPSYFTEILQRLRI